MQGMMSYTHPAVYSVLHLENNITHYPFTTIKKKKIKINYIYHIIHPSLIYKKKLKRSYTMKHCVHIKNTHYVFEVHRSIFFSVLH